MVKVACIVTPQASGKIEHPYHWLQDRIVRTCTSKEIIDIKDGQIFLAKKIYRY